jgi:hypothetical protein
VSPLRWWSFKPMTDSWALALLVTGFVTALLVLERGARWLPLWIASVFALSFTRDAGIVLALAAILLALRSATGRAALLAATGAVAILPAPLAFGAPLREALAYTFNHFYPAPNVGWNFVFERYWPQLKHMLDEDGSFVLRHPEVGLVYGAGVGLLFLLRLGRDPFIQLLRGGFVAAVLYLLVLPQYSAFRLELVLLPAAAVGLAAATERLLPMLLERIQGMVAARAA